MFILKVFVIETRHLYCDNYKAVVVAEDELHAERLAKMKISGFDNVILKVTEIDLDSGEQILSVENTGA